MGQAFVDISVSADGFIAGPDATLEEPLGRSGELLHEWVVGLRTWRQSHGLTGGETGPDDDLVADTVSRAGAHVMGRRMFSGGAGPWEDDPRASGWWGDEPPFRSPVFVLTHHPREPLRFANGTTFTFVGDGIEAAVAQARAAAGDRDVAIAGGAEAVQQALAAGLVDELTVHVVPLLLGGGVPLFAGGHPPRELERLDEIRSPAVTHLRYRIAS